jgi:hypothetical protein
MLASKYIRHRSRAAYLRLIFGLTATAACFYCFGLAISLSFVLLVILFLGVYITIKSHYYFANTGKKLMIELGVRHSTCYIKRKWGLRNVVIIESVSPDGLFHRAGFRPKDIILDDLGFIDFIQLLEKQRGGEPITFCVATLDDSIVTTNPPKRLITVHIPAAFPNSPQ